MYYIGVDLGTSSMKMILMDHSGSIKESISESYELYFPQPTWSEQNPVDWWLAFKEGINKITKTISKDEIKGLSFGGQMHGLVMLDEKDEVIRPAILWNDGRSFKETAYLNDVIGKERLSKETGNIAFAGFTAPKILWVKNNEPENFKRISKIMLPKDYLLYMLTGVFASDISDASGMLLLDVEKRQWSKNMLEICGINESQLPRLFESYEVVGNISKSVASELGLSIDTKVIAGAGDNAAAAIGTGRIGNGSCNISIGTSGTVFIALDDFSKVEGGAIHSFGHSDGNYHLLSCMLSAASCNKWWMDDILNDTNYTSIQNEMKLGENNVFFLPYLMGERSPHNDVNARGAFIGMSMDTTRVDMAQAVLEGVAFGIRDSFEIAKELGIDIKRSKICGGGAKSDVWKTIICNVLGIELEVDLMEEGPALGACILAMVGCNEYSSMQEAIDAVVKVVNVIKPDKALSEQYNEKYELFKAMYPALKPVYELMASKSN